jgi:hypothetical protein
MADSLHQLSKMRSSMKQATSAVSSGTLPVMQKAQRRYSTTAGSDFFHSMTSTAGLRQAGAKKWVTVARSGRFISLKISSAGSELVFEVISASGPTTASIMAKILRFSGRFSVAASITQSASAMSA